MIPLYKKKGFDTAKYLEAQTKAIKERVSKFDGKLYLEFGGKLCYDLHAARVLPGYEPTAKIQLLKNLKEITWKKKFYSEFKKTFHWCQNLLKQLQMSLVLKRKKC